MELWCWHCCHPFPGEPVRFPIEYDDRRDSWKVAGYFCSWSCAKTWNVDRAGSGGCDAGARECLLGLYRKKCAGIPIKQGIVPAPPRQLLRVFGGTMSIEDFRRNDKIVHVLPERVVPLERIVTTRALEAERRAALPGPDLDQRVDLVGGGAKTANENLRLKLRRAKPAPTDPDALAQAMGLVIN